MYWRHFIAVARTGSSLREVNSFAMCETGDAWIPCCMLDMVAAGATTVDYSASDESMDGAWKQHDGRSVCAALGALATLYWSGSGATRARDATVAYADGVDDALKEHASMYV